MTEGKQKELLDMVSAAEAEAKSARLKVAAAERARVKEKQEAEERFSRLEADLVSRHGDYVSSPPPHIRTYLCTSIFLCLATQQSAWFSLPGYLNLGPLCRERKTCGQGDDAAHGGRG